MGFSSHSESEEITMKITRKISALLACAMLTITSMGSFSANAAYSLGSVTEDNGSDDTAVGFSEITGTYLYGQTAMIADSNGSNYYDWKFSTLSKMFNQETKCKAKVGAYLRHSSFTDPSAAYSVQICGAIYAPVGTIDQEYALNGWNYIESEEFDTVWSGGNEWISCSKAEVCSSSSRGDQTGANAIYVSFTYGY